MTPRRLDEIESRVNAATPQTPLTYPERISFENGEFAYEVNDDHHIVSFYEGNHRNSPTKAKFNADLYGHAREDIRYLLAKLKEAVGVIEDLSDDAGYNSKKAPEHYCMSPCSTCKIWAEARAFLKEMNADE